MTALYVYAVVDRDPGEAMGPGIAGRAVHGIACGPFFAIVEAVAAAPGVTTEMLRAHDRVVHDVAARVEAVLPVRFGTVMHDEAELATVLRDREASLVAGLRLVHGCEQVSLRVYGPPAGGSADTERDPASDVHPLDGQRLPVGAETPPGTRYLLERRRRRRSETQLPELAPLRARLGGLVRAERVERHRAGPLCATAHHLIPRATSEEYRQAAIACAPALLPYRVAVSGPWAPYAFAPDGWRA